MRPIDADELKKKSRCIEFGERGRRSAYLKNWVVSELDINAMPTIEVDAIHGEWRVGKHETKPTDRFVCSVCDGLVIVSTFIEIGVCINIARIAVQKWRDNKMAKWIELNNGELVNIDVICNIRKEDYTKHRLYSGEIEEFVKYSIAYDGSINSNDYEEDFAYEKDRDKRFEEIKAMLIGR